MSKGTERLGVANYVSIAGQDMKVQQAYADWSTTYDDDRNLTRDLDEQVTKAMLEGLRCRSILEFGCGTGKNTALLARIGEQVQALDFSEQMIARAKHKVATPNVKFDLADITKAWPVPDQSVDLLVCNLVLEHVENILFVFAEASRVLVNRGRFFLSELHPFRQYQGVQAHFNREENRTEIPAFIHNVSDFIDAATANSFGLGKLNEWWHVEDNNRPPRLISFMFQK